MKRIKVFEEFKGNSSLNESMPLSDYYRNANKGVKNIAKEIDAIIDTADFVLPTSRDKLLDLITDLTDAYLSDIRNKD